MISKLADAFAQGNSATIPTAAGATDLYLSAPVTGKLTGAQVTPLVALAANNTNYVTWTVTNLGQAGAGTAVMLAATDANTTKATGGTALAVNTKHSLALNGSSANLDVTEGDRLKITATGTGTLANTVTIPTYLLKFKRYV